MIQCQGCTGAGWLWEGEGGLGDHQPGVYVPLKALFLVIVRIELSIYKKIVQRECQLGLWYQIGNILVFIT